MTTSKRVILKIGGEEVDITELPVLTIGDKKALGKMGINFSKLSEISPDDESKLIAHIIRKARPTTTDAEVDALSIKVGQDVLSHALTRSSEVDSPLSPSSTPSAGTTGGVAAS